MKHILGQRRSADIQLKLEIVEKFNESCRWKEERRLVTTEIHSFLRYFNSLLRSLSEDIKSMPYRLEISIMGSN